MFSHCIGTPPTYILRSVYRKGSAVPTARVFKSGNSQAVRLPKAFRLRGKEVEIYRRGNEVVLREKDKGLARAFDLLAELPPDAMPKRPEDRPPQTRKGL
jgi:antitoxin VapB